MDAHRIIKIVAIVAVIFLVYKLWSIRSNKTESFTIPSPYNGFSTDRGIEYDINDDVYDGDSSEDDYEDEPKNNRHVRFIDGSQTRNTNDVEITDREDDALPNAVQPMTPLLSAAPQLLPQPQSGSGDFAQFAPKHLESQNFLTASQWVGVNTQGSSLKNANYDMRANPVIPKVEVSPWMTSTIESNTYAKQLFG